MKIFNTSGPNNPDKHYTIIRHGLISKGKIMVDDERYFTIWAPRQTGKSTYLRQLAAELKQGGYQVAHINFENYRNASLEAFLRRLIEQLNAQWQSNIQGNEIADVFYQIEKITGKRCVFIVDEVEGINQEYFGDFLHSVRNAYHNRESHGLKSVILVGVTNITGIVSDNASPFNITDNLDVPYFTDEEVYHLLGQHEQETGQLFADSVKRKICEITANQPGLVNGFAKKLVEDYPDKERITYADFLEIEDWYLRHAIDKNFENILSKAKQERTFVERLLFTESRIPFKIDRPSIKILHANGLIKDDGNGYVTFWVPFYKKRLYDALYPYMNGEGDEISRSIYAPDYFTKTGELNLDYLVQQFKAYVKRRGFRHFREKDEKGNFKSIKEAALLYSFETYIHSFITQTEGKIYREADTGLGKSDMIINVNNREYLIEAKVYYAFKQFSDGKKQLAYYCNSLHLDKGVYLVFCPNDITYPQEVQEQTERIEGVAIATYLVEYDEEKW